MAGALMAPPGTDHSDRVPPSIGGYLLFLAVAIPASCLSLIALPGAHVTLAPLFYLIALKRWGFLPGLVATVVLTVPNLWLSDLPLKLALAIGHVLFVWACRRRALLLGEATALYNIAVLPLAGVALLVWGQASLSVALLIFAQYLVGEVLVAATADVLRENFTLVRAAPFVRPSQSRSLDRVLRTMINFVIALLFCMTLVNAAGSLHRLEHDYRAHVRSVVDHVVRRSADEGSITNRAMEVSLFDGSNVRLFMTDRAEGFRHRAAAGLGGACRGFVAATEQGSDLASLVARPNVCEIQRIREGGRLIYVTAALDEPMPGRYGWLAPQLALLFLSSIFVILYRVSLIRALERTLYTSEQTIVRFGEPDLPRLPRQAFREFDGPLRRFIERNNSYVAAIEERDSWMRVARSLKRSIDLQLISDIRFLPDSGLLRFVEVRLSEDSQLREIQVHAGDCALFTGVSGSEEAMVEFRAAGSDELETFLITLRQSAGPCAWDSGMTVKLRQSKRLRDLMIRQARLIDLGSMASAISHEIKQPLFTIAMAAESIQILLGRHLATQQDQQIGRLAERISGQVDRAREIIRRISHYGQSDTATAVTDAAAALQASYSFLQPLLEERAIDVTTRIAAGSHLARVSRIALEQVIVNAIQNAADAIVTARDRGRPDAGNLILSVDSEDETVRCTIIDDGTGLAAGVGETAFDPFFTTKSIDKGTGLGLFISRQIITEAGGTIQLLSVRPHGAQIQICLPLSMADDEQAYGGVIADG